jgi:16S rRNA G966 N2-methylase RsmD
VRVPEEQTEIYNTEAADFLHQALTRKLSPWDVIFFDPPYKEDYLRVLEFLASNPDKLLAPDGIVVAEHYHKNQLPESIGKLQQTRVLKQGDSALSFFKGREILCAPLRLRVSLETNSKPRS